MYPFPPYFPQWLPPLKYLVVTCCFLGTSLRIPVLALAVCSGIFKGLGWGGGFDWDWVPSEFLPEYVEPCAVFPLRALYDYPVRRHHGPPDAPVCGPHQIDGNSTLDVSARP